MQVHIGNAEVGYDVQDLSPGGFAISPPSPLPMGILTHVSFQLAPGLSVSARATAHERQVHTQRQWFDFKEIDREVLALLMFTARTASVH